MRSKRATIGFIIALVLISMIYLVLIELSKNTVPGWILTLAAIAGFIIIRKRLIGQDLYHGKTGLFCWLGFIAVLAVIYFVTAPPVKRVPAVEGFGVKKTGIVTVSEGDLQGVYNKAHTVEIYAGIPYAKPPIGELRWKEPQSPESYGQVLVCDTYGPMAMQNTNGGFA